MKEPDEDVFQLNLFKPKSKIETPNFDATRGPSSFVKCVESNYDLPECSLSESSSESLVDEAHLHLDSYSLVIDQTP